MTALVSSFKDSPSKDEPSTPGSTSSSTTSKVTKLTKLIKIRTWSRNISLETFKKQLQSWTDSNEEIPEFLKYHELIKSSKSNRDIKDLPRYVGEHVLPVLLLKRDQTITKAIKLLEVKYGRSRTKKIE